MSLDRSWVKSITIGSSRESYFLALSDLDKAHEHFVSAGPVN